nr:MAG TPA: hypothetical protein [Caudoviricetes sp.]
MEKFWIKQVEKFSRGNVTPKEMGLLHKEKIQVQQPLYG